MALDNLSPEVAPAKGATSAFGDTYWCQGQFRADGAALPTPRAVDTSEFRELADNLPTLCWSADADGYITWYNRRWHEYCGTTPEQMEGWGWQSVHDPAVLPKVPAG